MTHRALIATAALAAALTLPLAAAQAFDESKYPDWSGAWRRLAVPGVTGQPGYDQTKRLGRGQQAPLTPEATAIMEASIADQAKGGQGNYPTYTCLSPGMPRIMTPYGMMEMLITPDTTHVLIEHVHDSRRIYTDGRDWPSNVTPTLQGYSIGKWIDTDGDGRYDTLEVETRGMKGPRVFDASGIPLHEDNETIVLERIYLDKADKNLLHDDITAIDHALTRPWRVTQTFRRIVSDKPLWFGHEVCGEGNAHVGIGKEI